MQIWFPFVITEESFHKGSSDIMRLILTKWERKTGLSLGANSSLDVLSFRGNRWEKCHGAAHEPDAEFVSQERRSLCPSAGVSPTMEGSMEDAEAEGRCGDVWFKVKGSATGRWTFWHPEGLRQGTGVSGFGSLAGGHRGHQPRPQMSPSGRESLPLSCGDQVQPLSQHLRWLSIKTACCGLPGKYSHLPVQLSKPRGLASDGSGFKSPPAIYQLNDCRLTTSQVSIHFPLYKTETTVPSKRGCVN